MKPLKRQFGFGHIRSRPLLLKLILILRREADHCSIANFSRNRCRFLSKWIAGLTGWSALCRQSASERWSRCVKHCPKCLYRANKVKFSLALLFCLLTTNCQHEDSSSPYLTPNGTLKHSITLEISQEGAAGETGTILTIETNGSWKFRYFQDDGSTREVGEPDHRGTLNPEKVKALVDILVKEHMTDLPDELGHKPKVNERLHRIKFGKKTTTLVMNENSTEWKKADKALGNSHSDNDIARFIASEKAIQSVKD
jgi:hypothetical protein